MRERAVVALVAALFACSDLRAATDDVDGGGARADGGAAASSGSTSSGEPEPDAATPVEKRFDAEWAMWPVPRTLLGAGDYAVTDATVLDERTRLVWQRVASPSTMTQDAARAACAGLVLDGEGGFRLPTRIELLSIVDYGRTSPALQPTAFASATEDGDFWSSSADARAAATRAWVVGFADGAPRVEDKTSAFRVRCVRAPSEPRADYTLVVDAATDEATGLTWQRRQSPDAMSWPDALLYCQAATTGGRTGWRLPSARELESLVDVRAKSAPAWRTDVFGTTDPALVTWSSTSVVDDSTRAHVVDFGPAHATRTLVTTGRARVRCVTGP